MADYIDGMVLPTSAKLQRGKYTEGDLKRLLKLAEEGAYDAEAVEGAVFFPVIASANTIDSYGTFMMPSTLKNFAEDATNGVAVLDSHNSRRLNFGMSVTGEYVQDGDIRFMRSDFFTIPGLRTEGLDTDTYIKGIQAGLFRDISVGFWMPPGAMVRCTICGKDMMRWWTEDGCSHFPGMEYAVGDDGKKTEFAYGAVEEGRLSEYSTVHDGATPGAGVAKARNMEDAGELAPEIALQLERTYHTTFPRATRKYQGYALIGETDMPTKNKAENTPIEDENEDAKEVRDTNDLMNEDVSTEATVIEPISTPEPDALIEGSDEGDDEDSERAIEKSSLKFTKGLRKALNDRYADNGIRIGESVSEAVVTLADEVKRLRDELVITNNANRSLEDEAAIGRVYRTDLIEELKREVIRSADADEDKEAKVTRYQKLAETADIETIKALRDDFAAAARAKYGAGRRTVENEQTPNKEKASVPVTAYDDM